MRLLACILAVNLTVLAQAVDAAVLQGGASLTPWVISYNPVPANAIQEVQAYLHTDGADLVEAYPCAAFLRDLDPTNPLHAALARIVVGPGFEAAAARAPGAAVAAFGERVSSFPAAQRAIVTIFHERAGKINGASQNVPGHEIVSAAGELTGTPFVAFEEAREALAVLEVTRHSASLAASGGVAVEHADEIARELLQEFKAGPEEEDLDLDFLFSGEGLISPEDEPLRILGNPASAPGDRARARRELVALVSEPSQFPEEDKRLMTEIIRRLFNMTETPGLGAVDALVAIAANSPTAGAQIVSQILDGAVARASSVAGGKPHNWTLAAHELKVVFFMLSQLSKMPQAQAGYLQARFRAIKILTQESVKYQGSVDPKMEWYVDAVGKTLSAIEGLPQPIR